MCCYIRRLRKLAAGATKPGLGYDHTEESLAEAVAAEPGSQTTAVWL